MSSRDTGHSSEHEGSPEVNPAESRGNAGSPLCITDQTQTTRSPPRSGAQGNQTSGAAGGFFRRDSRFSPSPAREGSHQLDAGELCDRNAGEDQDDEDQVSSYNAIAIKDAEEEEPPRETRAPARAPSYNLMRIEGAHFNGKEALPPDFHHLSEFTGSFNNIDC